MLTNAAAVALLAPAPLPAVLTDAGQAQARFRLVGPCFLRLLVRLCSRRLLAIGFNAGAERLLNVLRCSRPSRRSSKARVLSRSSCASMLHVRCIRCPLLLPAALACRGIERGSR